MNNKIKVNKYLLLIIIKKNIKKLQKRKKNIIYKKYIEMIKNHCDCNTIKTNIIIIINYKKSNNK